jgi:pyruvate dehydrogenase E1 component beta subunit
VPIGPARIAREGTDVTIVTIAALNHGVRAADKLSKEDGVNAEVVELRTLAPLDEDAIIASVAKTGHLVVVDIAHTTPPARRPRSRRSRRSCASNI